MKRWIAIAALAALPVAAQQDFSKVEVKTQKLSDTVYMLEGAGGNLGVSVGEDAVFVVDDQYAPMAPKIQAAIAALTAKPVKFILNTHWHGDHTGGNETFGKAGAIVVAHENVRRRMSTEQFIELFKAKVPASPKAALPIVTFASDVTFQLSGEEIRAIHVPRAHTDGDAIVHFVKADVIHMGDTFFHPMYPFIDSSSGGTADGMIAAADKVLAMAGDKTKIIPGHGPLATKADLKAYRDMLAELSGRVAKLAKAGKTMDEIKAANVGAGFDEKWGNGFIKADKFVEMLAAPLLKK
ncbi:MBL fold metallo-hydrolase [Betaproteobacteria bacterium GR16-43]|nr:MBL fold metallo-hydrolase [Betaproteobacteria bacterium GR16-43]